MKRDLALCIIFVIISMCAWVLVWRKYHHAPVTLPEVMVTGHSDANHLGGLEQ